ncbi:hypothetical protein [uncultured Flavobacterium sp.]|uniref:hypothetical protein n=1 Tax=uncultured Flavobacterium sp. TaxID=165435 RepID=UPI002624F527|nr:hypothetical protein [uncultured Flavobacterium sp.]
MDGNKIIKVNNLPSVQRLEVSLKLTDKILAISKKEWWDNLELNWKIILLSNYCFNYDKHIKWNLRDCDIECPAMDRERSSEEYLIGFAKWVWGSDFPFNEYIVNVPRDILNFIINDTRFLWCADIKVETINPLKKLSKLKDVQGIVCHINEKEKAEITMNYDFFQWFDTIDNRNEEIGKKKSWEEYNENKNGL